MEWYQGRFAGQIVVVTGASSGIGRSTAERLMAEGATVVGADVGDPPALKAEGGRFVFVHTDIRDEEAAVEAVSAAVEIGGRLDGLVHAAGVGSAGMAHQMETADWERTIDINLTGTFVMAKAALAQMITQEPVADERGSLVTIASVGGLAGLGGACSYNASKAGVILLTRTLAVDYGPMAIRANTICPGVINTPLSEATLGTPELKGVADSYRSAHALRRFGEADEVAAAAAFLLSRDASFVSGTTFTVDGGYSAGQDHGVADLFKAATPRR